MRKILVCKHCDSLIDHLSIFKFNMSYRTDYIQPRPIINDIVYNYSNSLIRIDREHYSGFVKNVFFYCIECKKELKADNDNCDFSKLQDFIRHGEVLGLENLKEKEYGDIKVKEEIDV